MSDDTQDESTDESTPKPPAADDLGDKGKKALDQERKARRDAERKAKDLEDRLQAIEDKDKSDVDRLTEQVATLTQERDSAVSKADRLEVAVLKSLDEDKARRITSAAKRLTGATREELEADADEFLTAFAPQSEDRPPPPGGKPREQLKPGTTEPDTPVEETDIRKIGERMFAT